MCPACGAPLPTPSTPPRWGYYIVPRFQVDPSAEPLARDPRLVLLALGIAAVILGGLLLVVDGIVTSASGAAGPTVEYLFLLPGLGLLGVGATASVVAVARTL